MDIMVLVNSYLVTTLEKVQKDRYQRQTVQLFYFIEIIKNNHDCISKLLRKIKSSLEQLDEIKDYHCNFMSLSQNSKI